MNHANRNEPDPMLPDPPSDEDSDETDADQSQSDADQVDPVEDEKFPEIQEFDEKAVPTPPEEGWDEEVPER